MFTHTAHIQLFIMWGDSIQLCVYFMFNAHMSPFSGERVIAQGAHIGSTVITGVLPAPLYNPHPPKLEENVLKFDV